MTPATPHFLPAPPAGPPPNRLGLARWVVSPDNPLTARVAVSRIWQEVLRRRPGRDAGRLRHDGRRPSNPDLLDWLAVEFRDPSTPSTSSGQASSGQAVAWDVKHVYRLLVTSAAYQQSSRLTPALLEADPQNRLLARGPRFRMDAEMLRDTALQSAGLLVEKVGGPSVKPYQPPGIWEAVRGLATNPKEWVQDKGEGTYRRSMYTFLKRQAPAPDMDALNAPPRDVSCPRRDRTNTPLQALVLWNDPQWVEAARVLAQRAIREAGAEPRDRLDYIAGRVLSRPLEEDERRIFMESLESFRQRYDADPKAAAELLGVGDTKADASLPPAELAAWTLVASQVMNTDEALNK